MALNPPLPEILAPQLKPETQRVYLGFESVLEALFTLS
jgi:hypothetical protein